MRRLFRWIVPVLPCLAVGVAFASSRGASAAEPVDYARQVKPLLKARCYACHGALKKQAGLRLDTGEAIRRGGDSGPAADPTAPDESPLIERVAETDVSMRMPPEGEGSALSAEQIGVLRAWVAQGAPSPSDEKPEPDPRTHWSFSPPKRPAAPVVDSASQPIRNPIDAFLAASRETIGADPLGPAEPEVLLRRVHLDLTGLPPTRSQLREFLADPSDEAYARVVDRLLASPQYGERWARHWMDVWRYSDWYGRRAVPDVLNSYAMIWRWRDWIVRSLNEDRGYDGMVRAMLAADELSPNDPAELAATGFLVRNFYRWNYNTWMKDNVEHTGKAFLGLTFNCAHCHDHKYDPIKHEDYFALRAAFEPLEIRHDRVPGEPDPGPYPKYVYGAAYKPITSGMVRIFDEKLDAKTFLYTRGEARNVVPGRPPIPAGMPGFLGGKSFHVEPVELPAEAAYPGLKEFVRVEETARLDEALAKAVKALSDAKAKAEAAERDVAEAESASGGGPIAFAGTTADALAFAFVPVAPSPKLAPAHASARAANLALDVAQADHDAAEADRVSLKRRIAADDARYGRTKGDVDALRREASKADRLAKSAHAAAALAKAESAVAAAKPADQAKAASARDAARKALDAAKAEAEKVSVEYSPIGPVYPSKSTGRRSALARWIVARDNPLAARVAVNHIWRWHFGTPLVATTYDFGRNGAAPSNPELLDWLAVELMEPSSPGVAPWSMKAIHRLIVSSASYRSASHAKAGEPPVRGAEVDPENRTYWRFSASRLEAEEVRDAVLHVAGALDPALGGPDIDFSQGLSSRRRSLYFTHHGEARMPFLELFDAPDACDAYRRTTSVVPQQALALVNNALLLDLSRELAARLWDETAASTADRDDAFLTAAFEQVLARGPSTRERALSLSFLARQAALLGAVPDAPSRARRDLVHALFSHNDFITIH